MAAKQLWRIFHKQSDISVTRVLKFIKFCCDESGEAEEDLFSFPNMIDYMLGSSQLLTNFVDSLHKIWGIGQSGHMAYVASISDLLDFRKFCSPPASVLQNFAVTKVYVKRMQKCLAKDEIKLDNRFGYRDARISQKLGHPI